jgi:PAS domain S-box-containing protein
MPNERISDALARGLVEAAPDALLLVDAQGRIAFANAQAEALFGYSRDELLGQPIELLVPEAARARHQAHHAGFVAAPRFRAMGPGLALSCRRRDGSELPVEIHLSPVSTAEGLYTAAAVRDVSERQRTEAALQRSEDSLLRSQRLAHIGSWDWDLRTNEVARSAELFALFGIAPDLRYKRPFSLVDGIHPDDRAKVRAATADALAHGGNLHMEFRIVLPDGSERIVLSQGEMLRDEQGRPVRMVGISVDLTEHRRLQQAADESLRWLRTVLDQCPVAIVLVHGPLGDRVECNRCAQTLIGCSGDRCEPGAELQLFADETLLSAAEHPTPRALRGQRTSGLAVTLKTATGALVPILLDAAPILDDSGAVSGAVVVFQDITFLKQIDRMRAEWNSVIAHDLRQPLNAIALTAQLLARKKKNVADLTKPIERIMQSALRLDRMINDLLDLSRLEVRQLKLARRPVELSSIIRASVERSALEAPDHHVEVRGADGLPALYLDADRITQVLDNLLSNAVKYGEPGSAIHITVEPRPTEVAVAVTNTGAGIPAAELPHLFQRFRRVNDPAHGAIKGIGLGLYIVQQLVEAHGGKIQAESTPGQTTTFRFTLPCSQPATA